MLKQSQSLSKVVQPTRNNADWSTDFIKISRPGVEGYNLPPLTEKLNDRTSSSQFCSVTSRNFDTHVTKLDSGLRVATEKLFGEFCTVGGDLPMDISKICISHNLNNHSLCSKSYYWRRSSLRVLIHFGHHTLHRETSLQCNELILFF